MHSVQTAWRVPAFRLTASMAPPVPKSTDARVPADTGSGTAGGAGLADHPAPSVVVAPAGRLLALAVGPFLFVHAWQRMY